MISIFISYSHADEELRRQLDVHLASLKRQGIVYVWHDRRIPAGADFPKAIDAALTRANIVLLLVSPDFIASGYCYDVEMAEALHRHERGEVTVIPVILRACDWHDLPFGRLMATPTDGKPVRLFPDLDSAFLEVVRDIKVVVLSRADTQASSKTPRRGPQPGVRPAVLIDEPRSGNLGVRKTFTDFDRDRFRTDTFEYLSRYFENSLIELGQRNAGIRSSFQRIDASAFEATIYDELGNVRSRCGVWLSSGREFGGDISYSGSGVGARRSYNESLAVEDNGVSLGMRAMGMFGHTEADAKNKLLTQEGGAEYLWGAFIAPLQR